MPVAYSTLKAHGCTPRDWKRLFTAPGDKKFPAIKRLELLIQNRMADGRLRNLMEYRPYAAIDLAYNASFNQTTPTILADLMSRRWEKQEDLMASLKTWGISMDELFLKDTVNGQEITRFDPPTFYKIVVNLVLAYVRIRWAKLFNERNTNPLLKYDPQQANAESRIQCEIVTCLIQEVSVDYGYSSVLRQAILQALMYSFCMMFPQEPWHTEYYTNGAGEKQLEREGIRYVTPHPCRTSWDLNHPVSSFNSDTGCEWAQYWGVTRYGEVLDNPLYWNRRVVGYTQRDWTGLDVASNFFQEVYPCTAQFPMPQTGSSPQDRESNAQFYTSNERDNAVFLTHHFMKLVPSKWGLGRYKKVGQDKQGKDKWVLDNAYEHPVWVRFVLANDTTVIYAEPICYAPVLHLGYDTNLLNSQNSSLALEVLPFQDMVGNVLSQVLLTVKQNLANVTFVDENILSSADLDRLKNRGETLLRGLNFVPFDSAKNARAPWGSDMGKAIIPVRLETKDTTPQFQALNTLLTILERLLQLSSQESGSAGPHQQSKEEVQQIGSSTSNRVQFTGGFIDDFTDAWKWQLYYAVHAYRDPGVTAWVPNDITDVEEELQKLGFEVVSQGEGKLKISGKKDGIKIDTLAGAAKGPDKKNDSAVAQVMMQAVSAVAANEALAQAVGAKPLLKAIETAARLAGADRDFKLKPDQKQEMQNLMQLAQQIQMGAVKQIEQDVTKPVADEIAKIQKQVQELQQGMQALLQKIMPPQAQPPPAPPAPMPLPPQPLPPQPPNATPIQSPAGVGVPA